MSVKKIVVKIHLWLGLASGAVIVFLGLTGCILAFQREIEDATQEYRYVKEQPKEFLPPSKLKNIGAAQLPGKHLHAVLYGSRDKAAQVIFYQFEPVQYYYIVYLDPYTGQVQKVKDMDKDFFRQVVLGHFYLWLPPHIGQPIVASSTLVFVIMMISGLILWWPRNKAARRQRFTIKFNARWRRINYDLHNVLGFYMTWLAIILAFTGLIWGFQWFANGVYSATGGEKNLVYQEPLSDTTGVKSNVAAIDVVWDMMKKQYPNAQTLEVHIPESASSPIAANANPDAATYWKIDYRYFDQYSFKELPAASIYGQLKEAAFADKVIRMNYDIHTGAVIGLPGKILMFFASLIAASLPVTGVYLWIGRRRKKKKPASVTVYREEAMAV
jgi:uncharacterized iron-regulated membrane protein